MLTFGFIVQCFSSSLCCEVHWGNSRAVMTGNTTPLPSFLKRTCFLAEAEGDKYRLHDNIFLYEKSFLAISHFKKRCTWEVKEGVNNLDSFLEEGCRWSTLDSRTASLWVMCYHYVCIAQSQVSTLQTPLEDVSCWPEDLPYSKFLRTRQLDTGRWDCAGWRLLVSKTSSAHGCNLPSREII